jgi:cytochrome b561
VLFQIPADLLIASFDLGPLYDLHKSVGVLVLTVAGAGLVWRLVRPPPALPAQISRLQRLPAYAVHWALYALLIVQGAVDWIATSAYPAPVPFFGLFEMPSIWWHDRALSDRMIVAHLWIGMLMALLLVGHIEAALYHHMIRRDEVLMRMCGDKIVYQLL